MCAARTRIYQRKLKAPPRRRRTVASYVDRGVTSLTLIRKLPYFTAINIDSAGAPANHVFSANGCFDPDITGVGHQPLGFDQYMALYDHYKVLSSVITVDFLPATTAALNNQMFCGVILVDDVTPNGSLQNIIENNAAYATVTSGAGAKATRVKNKFDIATYFKSRAKGANVLIGSSTANPTEGAFFHVWAAPCSSGDAALLCVGVKIEYIVQFSEATIVAQS